MELLEIQRYEWYNFRGKKAKIDWLVEYFAPRFGKEEWKKSDFRKMKDKQLNAVWARYYRIYRTAKQIALERYIAPEDRQKDLDIGKWINPFLQEQQLQLF